MPCLVALIALAAPRLAIILVVLFSDYIGRAYQTTLWPLLGFFFAPYTTLAYAWAKNTNGTVDGIYLIIVIIAVLVDIGVLGGGASRRKERVVVRRD